MDIVVHLGAHRTASTTFQNYLGQNRKKFNAMGVHCWTPRQTRDGRMEGFFRRPDRISPLNLAATERSVGRIILQQRMLAREGAKTLLISEENLLGNMGLNLSRRALYPDVKARLSRIKPAFKSRISTLALTIRGFDTYWSSVLGHRLLKGSAMLRDSGLDQLVTQPRRWRHVVEDIAAVFPEVPLKVFAFERVAGRPEAILTELVAPLPKVPRYGARGWHNPRRPAATLDEILRERGDDSAIPLGKGDGKWHPFNALQTDTLRAQYEEDLTWLRAGAGGLAQFVEHPAGPDFSTGAPQHRRQARRERQKADGTEPAVAGAVA